MASLGDIGFVIDLIGGVFPHVPDYGLLTVPRTGEISHTVDLKGATEPTNCILLSERGGEVQIKACEPDGSIAFYDLPPGRYELMVSGLGEGRINRLRNKVFGPWEIT